jgi:hypothetical protein
VHDFAKHLVIDLPESFCVHRPDVTCLLVFRLVPFCLTPLGLVKVAIQRIMWDNYSSIMSTKVNMKVIIDKASPSVLNIDLDEEAMKLSNDDLSILLEDAKRNIESMLLSLYESVE